MTTQEALAEMRLWLAARPISWRRIAAEAGLGEATVRAITRRGAEPKAVTLAALERAREALAGEVAARAARRAGRGK
jgi:hypothetical protein